MLEGMQHQHIIIYSHGFGVQKDDRGLFTDIAAGMPKIVHQMFDYNAVNEAARTLTVSPFQDQVHKLKQVYTQTRLANPQAIIDIIAHSQGCLVAALAKPEGVRRSLFLAPPSKIDGGRLIKLFSERPGSNINLEGISTLQRRDGTTTIVPSQYWHSVKNLNPIKIYNRFCEMTDMIIIEASDDDVLGISDFDEADSKIKLEILAGDHDFTGEDRQGLVELVGQKIGSP